MDDFDGWFVNRLFLINLIGDIVVCYDKIYMFDVVVLLIEIYCEFVGFCFGDCVVLVKMDFGMVGLMVCYDVCFFSLFCSLV